MSESIAAVTEFEEHPFNRLNRELCEKLNAAPCPFCGGKPLIYGPNWHIVCQSCWSSGPTCVTQEDAARAWNARPAIATAHRAIADAAIEQIEADETFNKLSPIWEAYQAWRLAGGES